LSWKVERAEITDRGVSRVARRVLKIYSASVYVCRKRNILRIVLYCNDSLIKQMILNVKSKFLLCDANAELSFATASRMSITLRYCDHIGQNTLKIISRLAS